MVYKLNYACSKKRINVLIHEGLMYEEEHGIEQPDKDTIKNYLIEEIKQLKADREEMYKLCYTEAGLTPDCNPYYCVKKLQEENRKLMGEILQLYSTKQFEICGILKEVETTTSDRTILHLKDLEETK